MNIHEICVHIKDEEMLQKAKELLEKHGEIIFNPRFNFNSNEDFNYLYCCCVGDWLLGLKTETEITLAQLEGILENNKQN